MTENKKTDRRVLYTKMFLKESLLELMKEKPIDKITPTELCRRANINRNTFYSHYYTAREVLNEVEADFAAQIIEYLQTQSTEETRSVTHMLREICRIIYKQQDLCKILLSDNGDPAFFETLISNGKPFILDGWRAEGVDLNEREIELLFSFIVNGSVAVIQKWASTDMEQSPDKIADFLEHVTFFGIKGMTGTAE